MGEQTTEESRAVGRIAPRVRRGLRRIRRLLGDSPIFLPIVLRATPLGTSRRIRPSTQIVVEGFPRSGNTYAAFVMRYLLNDSSGAVVASQVHTPSQVRLAVARSVPTLVVIRRPDDAVSSLLVAAPHVSARSALNEWIHHYEILLPLAEQFVVASLPELISDMPMVLRRLTDRFGPLVDVARWTAESTAVVHDAMVTHHHDTHAGEPTTAPWPMEHRLVMHGTAQRQLTDPLLAGLRRRADTIFAMYLELAARRSP